MITEQQITKTLQTCYTISSHCQDQDHFDLVTPYFIYNSALTNNSYLASLLINLLVLVLTVKHNHDSINEVAWSYQDTLTFLGGV